MFIIPLGIEPGIYSIFVVLDDDNLERIKKYDPAEIVTKSLGPPWTGRKLKDIVITYATAAEQAQVIAMCREGRIREALRLLTRGWQYRPDRGDYDGPYLDGLREPGETTH
jgi:hypothetical protein